MNSVELPALKMSSATALYLFKIISKKVRVSEIADGISL
jgi:hypothetical protein